MDLSISVRNDGSRGVEGCSFHGLLQAARSKLCIQQTFDDDYDVDISPTVEHIASGQHTAIKTSQII